MLPKCDILTPFDQTNMGSISKPNPNLTLFELGIAPLDFKSRDSKNKWQMEDSKSSLGFVCAESFGTIQL